MRRKTLLLDLDNVVYPFTQLMAREVANFIDSGERNLIKDYKNWAIWDDWNISQGQFESIWHRSILTGRMYATGQVSSAARRALWQISDNEWHIHIVTARLNKFRLHDLIVSATAGWLAENDIPYRSISFTEDKHSIIGDAIVDDNPVNLIHHNARQKFLFPANHNMEAAARGFDDIDSEIIVLDGQPWPQLVDALGSGVE